ncbi:hypothetical protein EV121DRAFT_277952 [Schizophyllum commune]
MPATPPARLTTPTTKLATYADLYSILPGAAQARKCCQAKDSVTRGPGNATRRYYDLDMQVRCGDGIRPVPATLREPKTAGGLRADTLVSLGQVLGVIEFDTNKTITDPLYSNNMRRTVRRRPARGPRAIEAK